MTEKNRNISDVIHSITDDGPAASEAVDDAMQADADSAVATERQPTSYLWLVATCLLAGLLVAAIFLLGTGGGREPSSNAAVGLSESVNTRQANTEQLQELRNRVDLLDGQVKQLASVAAESNAILLKLLDQISGVATQASGADANDSGRVGQATLARSEPVSVATPEEPVVEETITEEAVVEEAAMVPVQPVITVAEPVDAEPKSSAVLTAQQPAGTEAPVVLPLDTAGAPATGGWVINVAFFERQEPVTALMRRFGAAGITTEQRRVTVNGVDGYRLRITGFSTQEEASDFMKNGIDKSLGIEGPWLSRYE